MDITEFYFEVLNEDPESCFIVPWPACRDITMCVVQFGKVSQNLHASTPVGAV